MRALAVLCLVAFGGVLTLSSWSPMHAQQQRSATSGVYTDAQATRGEAISQSRCIACHGENRRATLRRRSSARIS